MVQFRKLRLSGFKSFVDPTEIDIDKGLTGIVGPNGCGKSNLVEALRWAMGESSAKRMRGGAMDDVIFAGSATRPSRNLAEVVLTLDNGDRSAPAGFNDTSELEVARRIERDSGSAYRINGREVRARDVQLLFADSATGPHSTALVSQGRVGALINAKATDRRALLEEAAGITGLHSRRHEAELRLRAAETNLERLDDVVSTLEAQLKNLKKQARQASRYRNLAGHIRRQEALLLHLEAGRAKTGLAAARDALDQSQSEVAALTRSAAAAAADQAEAAASLPDLRHREAAAAAALQRLLVDRENLDREEAQVVGAQARGRQHLQEIDGDRARVQAQAEDGAAARTRLEAERNDLEYAAQLEVETRRAATDRRDAAATGVGAKEAELDRLATEVASDDARGAALARRVAELSERLTRLRGQADRIAEERAQLESGREDDPALSAATAALAEAETALGEAREGAETTAEILAADRDGDAAARVALQQIDAELAKVEAEIAAFAAILEADQGDIWPPILDTLTVEPGLEAALGAALGDDLGASADDAAPVYWHALPAYGSPQALPAGAEPLVTRVTGSAALARRLSQIGLVPDDATGARLQRDLAPGQRLVTRAGALWRWDGLTAMAEAPTAAATRLAQRNRLVELRTELPGHEERRDRCRATLNAARAAVQNAAAAERASRTALDAAFGAVAAARDRKAEIDQKAAAAASRRAALGETEQRLDGELGDCEAGLAQATAERSALPDLTAARRQVAEFRIELTRHRAELAEAQGALEQLAREAESRSRRFDAIDEESASWTRRTEDAGGHLETLAARRAEAEAELQALASRPADIAARRESLAAEIEAADRLRKETADALAEGETRLNDADRLLKAEEQKLATAREDRVRHEAAVGQCDQTLAMLDERVREKLDCDMDRLLEVAEVDPGQDLPALAEVEAKLTRLVGERDNMGPVNLRAEQEAAELDEQINEMHRERADLVSAIAKLRQGISSLNREGRQRLLAAFEQVDRHFSTLFERLFGGGRAHLKLTEAEDPLEAGLEIMASPPGKRLQVLSLLSGGEQALTALALLFAVFQTNPAPICVLDEVDAPLDDANVDRFCTLVEDLVEETSTRFLVVTHHRMTMARMDRLYGVTMAERGVSQLVSVDLDAAEELRETA